MTKFLNPSSHPYPRGGKDVWVIRTFGNWNLFGIWDMVIGISPLTLFISPVGRSDM
jgi:hypothetical protein